MADEEEADHITGAKKEGVFKKCKKTTYRKTCETCGKGYHGNRWEAHHILPGKVFTEVLKDDPIGFIEKCLKATPYDINADYSMGGLPKLTAFILFFQHTNMPYEEDKEKTVTMQRWKKVKQYAYQKKKKVPIVFPGNYPVHNPVNWGHNQYNEDVLDKLDEAVFDKLREKKDKKKHYKAENLKEQITNAKNTSWANLLKRGKMIGCGTNAGIEANLRARYSANNDGWWKPLCMADVDEPASP